MNANEIICPEKIPQSRPVIIIYPALSLLTSGALEGPKIMQEVVKNPLVNA